MIKLDIMDYCNNCTMFEPKVEDREDIVDRPSLRNNFMVEKEINKYVVCTNKKMCESMMAHLRSVKGWCNER